MVSSVGPYRFSRTELGAAFCHASAALCNRPSPQNKLHLSVGILPGFKNLFFCMIVTREGTENQTVIPCLLMKDAGAKSSIGCMDTTHAPLAHAMNRSKTDKSNV